MELLEPLDPTVELKIPLTGLESPGSIRLEAISKPSGEGTPIPKAAVADSPRTGPPTTGYFSTGSTESKIGPYGENTNEASENISGEQPTTEWPEQAIPTAIERSTTIRLGDLKDLLRLEQYHRDQASSQQRALDGQTLADGLNRRLLAVLLMAYQAMADSYQSGDQAEFASLYQTCEDLVEACKTQPWQPLPIEDLRHSGLDPEAPASSSWFDRLPLDCQESFLDFLTRLRNDTHFLADRLSALSFGDFAELCSSSRVSQASASVFGVHQRKTSGFARTPSLPEDSSPLERLRRFFEGDPFFVLCHTVFDSSREPSTHEYQRRVQVWSTACARVITEGKPGSDEFTIATLDAFSRNKTWRLAPQLETYVARMLQDGAFLLDPASKGPTSFKEPLEIRNANAAIATSKFFDRALKELLAILVDALPASIMPEGLLELVHSVLQGIPTSEVRSRARNFIVSKWYIPSFLGRILNNPEVGSL
ncbi:MAG: hypothetical protein L6R39_004008 [Caloplaca ligustica]|nr:MAG: hypothetical protein L6R39_004008 [Caloplaca ligustica]